MRLKNLGVLGGVAIFAMASLCASNVYLEVKTGDCFPQNKNKEEAFFKSCPSISTEFGYKLGNLRFDFQLGYSKLKLKETGNKNTVFNLQDIYRRAGADCFTEKEFTTLLLMLNVYYDYRFSKKFSIYFGIGGGFVRAKYQFIDVDSALGFGNDRKFDFVKNVFAAQFMTGVTYDINSSWALSLGYRCMRMKSSIQFHNAEIEARVPETLPPLKTPLLHTVEIGLRYTF